MEPLLEAIRAALAANASPEARTAGASACRAILAELDTSGGQPTSPAVTAPPIPIAQLIGALRGVPPEQLFDLAIAKLRAKLPDGTKVAVQPINFRLVPVDPERVR